MNRRDKSPKLLVGLPQSRIDQAAGKSNKEPGRRFEGEA